VSDDTREIPGSRARRAARLRMLATLAGALTLTLGSPATGETPPAQQAGFDLAGWAAILAAHTRAVDDVAGTRVDYAALRESADLRRVVASLAAARPSQLDDREARLAFWINAYNVLAVELVAKSWPVASIRDLGSFFSPVWDREVVRIEGRALSLGAIEHEILRKLGEPRIHAAIVCASTSCPSLARVPFRAATLDAQLDAAMRGFLADPRKGLSIDRERMAVRHSKIFSWFEEDFEAEGGPLRAIAGYVGGETGAWLRAHADRVDVDTFDYDWSVNGIR